MDIRKWLHGGAPSSRPHPTSNVGEINPNTSEELSARSQEAGAPVPAGNFSSERRLTEANVVSHPQPGITSDELGTEKPKQIVLRSYPASIFCGRKRSFVATWFHNRDWLEYSAKADAAFCFCCRNFITTTTLKLDVFVSVGYRNWKNATETDRGFHKHETSKEHLSSYTMWKERQRRINTGKEISTLINTDQLRKNRYYVSSLVDVVGFLVENQLPLRGKLDAFGDMSEGGSGLFLSLLDYTIKKDPELADIVKTIPRNATYTCHDMQNELINTLSSVVTEAIVEEVCDSHYTLKVDETPRDAKIYLLSFAL